MSECYNKKEEIISTKKYWTLLPSALGGRRKAYYIPKTYTCLCLLLIPMKTDDPKSFLTFFI